MNVFISFTSIGTDAGPFDLYTDSSVPPYCCAFASGITSAQLLLGYIAVVDDSTTIIRVVSRGVCTNTVDLLVPVTTTTTTTAVPTTTTTTTAVGFPVNFSTGFIDISIPCAATSYLNHEFSLTPPPIVNGQVIYTDPFGFTPVNGGGLFFKEQITQIVWQVSNTGVISNPQTCPTTTTTSSSTTTTTTTAAPTTTTTSTTLPSFRTWHLSSPSRSTAASACLNTNFSIVRYSIYQTGTTPAIGTILHSNSGLASPWNGGDQWYQVQEAFADNPTVIRVSGVSGPVGSVNVATPC